MKTDWTIVTHTSDIKYKGKYFGFGAAKEDRGDHDKFPFK